MAETSTTDTPLTPPLFVPVDPTTLNRADLGDFALAQYNLTFKAAATKAEILAAITEAEKAGPLVKYRVKRPIRHDKPYGIGAVVSLHADAAIPLLRTQAIEVATEQVPL